MWKHIEELHRPPMTMWRMHIACWIPKSTKTHSECVILIVFHYNSGAQTRLFVTLYVHCLSGVTANTKQ